jgi:hypothetical protein
MASWLGPTWGDDEEQAELGKGLHSAVPLSKRSGMCRLTQQGLA